MKKLLAVFVLLFCSVSFAQIQNWKGYLDTNQFWIKDTTTKKYSKVYSQPEGVATSLAVMVNDTTAAGLSADSTSFVYGFQVGGPVLNFSGLMDTAWAGLDTLDSISSANYAATQNGGRYSLTTDVITETWGRADTSNVTKFATQIHPVRAYNWDVFMRFWIIGKTGTRLAKPNKVIMAVRRQTAVPITGR